MKYIIVGLHSSGKQEVFDYLEQHGVKCGRNFSDIESASSEIYGSYNYELYSHKDIRDMFENNSYIFLKSLECKAFSNSYQYYEGLSFYEYDVNDVFVMSPDQVVSIPRNVDLGDVCFVWLDSASQSRQNRYALEKRSYNYNEREELEKEDLDTFIKYIYDHNVIYFNDEDPIRVATIVNACVQHPDLANEFIENFN